MAPFKRSKVPAESRVVGPDVELFTKVFRSSPWELPERPGITSPVALHEAMVAAQRVVGEVFPEASGDRIIAIERQALSDLNASTGQGLAWMALTTGWALEWQESATAMRSAIEATSPDVPRAVMAGWEIRFAWAGALYLNPVLTKYADQVVQLIDASCEPILAAYGVDTLATALSAVGRIEVETDDPAQQLALWLGRYIDAQRAPASSD